jgi:hypothetical protein
MQLAYNGEGYASRDLHGASSDVLKPVSGTDMVNPGPEPEEYTKIIKGVKGTGRRCNPDALCISLLFLYTLNSTISGLGYF